MTVFDNNGTIAISFEHRKKRFVLSGLGSYSDSKQLQQVQQTELRIKSDRKSNNFPFADNESVKLFYFPSSEDRQQMIARTIATERKADKLNPSLLSIWDKWVVTLGLSQATLNNHYHCCRQMILSSGNPKAHAYGSLIFERGEEIGLKLEDEQRCKRKDRKSRRYTTAICRTEANGSPRATRQIFSSTWE